MKIDDKFRPLFNQLNGSVKIRQRMAMTIPEPSIEIVFQELFKRIEAQNIHIEEMYKIMENRSVNRNLSNFDKSVNSARWVEVYLNESQENLHSLPVKVKKHLEKIKVFAERNNINIQENLNNISNILTEYENDPKLKSIHDVLNNKKAVIQEWEDTVNKCVSILQKNDNRHYNNNIDGNPDLIDMKKFIDDKSGIFEHNRTYKEPFWFNYEVVKQYMERLNNEHVEAFLKIRSTGIDLMLADNFFREKQNNPISKDVASFLQNKIDEDEDDQQGIKLRLDLDGYKTSEIIVFMDDSILGKRKDGSYFDIFTKKQLKAVHDSIVVEHIKNTFNKNPTVAKNFIEIFYKEESALSIKRLLPSIETYSNNIEFFNNKPFDLKAEYEDSFKKYGKEIYRVYEDLDDKMNKKIKRHKVHKLAHSIASNKYRNLYNEESYNIIEDIYDLNLKTDVFQEYIGKKIAAYKNPEQFNEGLASFLKSFNGFDMQSMTLKAENTGVRIISDSDNKLIIEIENYEQSEKLGSSSWCIVRDESYFNSYTGDGNTQYFLYDFSYDSSDNQSMVGFTIDSNGKHYAAHYKNDDEVNENESILVYAHDKVNELKERLIMVQTARYHSQHI